MISRFLRWLADIFDPATDEEDPYTTPLPATLQVRRTIWKDGKHVAVTVEATPVAVNGLTLVFQADNGRFITTHDDAEDKQAWGRWWRKLGGSAFLEGGEPYDPSEL